MVQWLKQVTCERQKITMLAPAAVQLPPITYHRHTWAVLISSAVSPEWPHDNDDEVIAVCACGKQMSREEIEAVLNS